MASAHSAASAGLPGDIVAVGPTGDTRSTLDTEAGPARSGSVPETPDLGHSGDPLVVDAQSSGAGDAERTGAAAGAASSAGVAGFGTDTGLSSSPTSGVLTGDPGARATSHAGSGTGDLVGEVGDDRDGWSDQPGARDDVTEAATDPVGEDWAGEPGAGSTTTSRRADESADDSLTGASTDPVGEDWDAGAGGTTVRGDTGAAWADDAGARSATTGTDERWTAAGSGPGEDREAQDTTGEGVVQRDFADENVTTDDVVARDFANRDISGEGVVERDFANRDITERDIANRGIEGPGIEDRRIVTGMGGAHVAPNPQPTSLDAADAPGPADGIGAGLEPLDPRTGTADDPDNPIRPSV